MCHHWRFTPQARPPVLESDLAAARFVETLSACVLQDARREIDVLLEVVREPSDPIERVRLRREILRLVNRLAHRKYRQIFAETLDVLRRYAEADPTCGRFRRGLEVIAERAGRRMPAHPPG
jgi:hypothetical protein